MELPPFPRDFSKQARANVIAVEIIASEAVAQAKEPQHALRSGVFPGNRMSGVVVQYIMSVFAPFAHEACELGRKPDGWAADTVDRESREFLRLVISNAKAKYSLPIHKLPEMLSHFNASVLASFQAVIELTDEWKCYQEELLEVARLQQIEVQAPKPSNLDHSHYQPKQQTTVTRKIREPNPEILKNKETVNHREAAEALGIVPRTLNRWIADGTLTPTRVASRNRFKSKDLQKVINQNKRDKT
jgi:excisionase family DNA binding protein